MWNWVGNDVVKCLTRGLVRPTGIIGLGGSRSAWIRLSARVFWVKQTPRIVTSGRRVFPPGPSKTERADRSLRKGLDGVNTPDHDKTAKLRRLENFRLLCRHKSLCSFERPFYLRRFGGMVSSKGSERDRWRFE